MQGLAVNDADGYRGPDVDEPIAVGELLEEHECVEDDDATA